MGTLHCLNFELLFQCVLVVVYAYAVIIAAVEVSVFYAVLPVLLYLILFYISMSPPAEYFVTKVLGENRRTQLGRINWNGNGVFDEFYPCIGYQAAALDSSDDALSAVKLCYKNGCKFVHIDVRITSDNVAVVGCLKNAIFSSVLQEKSVEESSFHDLSISSSVEHSECLNDPPTLEDAVKLCTVLDVHLMMNLIHSSYYRSTDSTVDVILELYKKYPDLLERCVISSTSPWLLYKIRRRNKNIVVALQWQSSSDLSITTISWLKKILYRRTLQHCLLEVVDEVTLYLLRNFVYLLIGISAVILPKNLITPGIVEYWERKNIRCIAAIVNLSSEKWYYEHALGIMYLTETVAQQRHFNF